ncbi:MAG TPA: Crp/Fnr family transcriptional regulator, partial [Burkholderiaceae bacterium]|nr:Crp/Fnr family transcriptional regulator [Burkholderiaceae bacterium]
MLSTTTSVPNAPLRASADTAGLPGSAGRTQDAVRRIGEAMSLVQQTLAPQRHLVREGDVICEAGQRFDCLYVMNSGCCKVVTLAGDGREQVVGLKFRGDWLGFDGIATGRYTCGTVAIDTGEVWVVGYQALLGACAVQPMLMALVYGAMSREISQERDSLMSVCTLPADARVAEFLRSWADSLSERGLRTDQITLPLSRAEIGNYLGLTLETVSRALSKLARDKVIGFAERRRRDLRIPSVAALGAYVQRCLA